MECYKKEELKPLEVYTEEHHGIKSYLAKAVYECENEYKKVEVIIPRIGLLVDTKHLPMIATESTTSSLILDRWLIDIFGTQRPLRPDKNGHVYYEKVIEEYPQKMTLAEIEKKLGHKIELVSEK